MANKDQNVVEHVGHADMPMDIILNQKDWAETVLGDRAGWPTTLQTAVNLCMYSSFPALILWGPDLVQIYNDAYRKLIGKKHPKEMGSKANEAWQHSNWVEVAPLLEKVIHEGTSAYLEDHKFISVKEGYPEERYYTISYSPIFGAGKIVHGVFCTVFDKTEEMVSKRLLRGLRGQPLEDMFFQSPIAVAVLKGPEMIIEEANPQCLEMWGKKADEVVGKTIWESLPEALSKEFQTYLRQAFREGKRVILKEHPLSVTRDGIRQSLYVKAVLEPVREIDGSVSGIMILADDITEQVSSRKLFEENEARLKLAIDAAEIGTFEWNMQGGDFRYSERHARIFGFEPEGHLSREDFGKRIHPEDEPERREKHRRSLETGSLFYELRIIWPDETIRWIRVNGKIVFDSGGKPWKMYGTTLDITEQKLKTDQLERLVHERTKILQMQFQVLKSSEERYHKMVDEVQDYAIILLDKDGKIQNWNRGAEKIKGYKDREIIGKHFSIFYSEEDRRRNLPNTLLRRAVETGRAAHEGYSIRKDGKKFWGGITITALHGEEEEIIGFSKVTRDLTARKEAEDQLRLLASELAIKNQELTQSEERYHRMIAEVQDYAIILLDETGIVQNWNMGAEKIKGYHAHEIVGKNFRIFYTDESREENLPEKLLEEARIRGKALQEGWRVRKDGSRFWGSTVITALHNQEGTIIGFSKVTRDLTERKSAEEKMHAYMAELEAQNKELEQFAYVASHDLQEPLRKILTFSEIIQRNIGSEEIIERYLEKVDNSAKRMSELIKAVLSYSQLSREQQFTNVDLNQTLENVKTDLELLSQEKGAVIKSDPLPKVKANALQLNQLLTNLLGNALKFSEQPPVVRVSSRKITDREILNKPENLLPGFYHEITVTDNGIGFEQQYADQIFHIFQRLHGKQKYSGTGIGLAICKKIVENHKGHIAVRSQPGEGATFYVYLPVVLF